MVPAFLNTAPLDVVGASSRRKCLSLARPRHFSKWRYGRVIIAGLYPEVDPPEHIDNPADPNNQSDERRKGEESLLQKLNDRTKKRKGIEAMATTLDEPEIPPSEEVPTVQTEAGVKTSQYDDAFIPAARALWRFGWTTWWVQLILSIISGIILLFSFAFPGVSIRSSASLFGFVLSGAGTFLAFVSLFWTYSYTRLSIWLTAGKGTAEQAASKISRKLRFGVLLSIIGMVVSLVGLQAIVGTLLARLFSAGIATTPYTAYQPGAQGAGSGLIPGTGIVQPVDVLVVQACANATMALLAGLISSVWLRSRSKKWYKKVKSQ